MLRAKVIVWHDVGTCYTNDIWYTFCPRLGIFVILGTCGVICDFKLYYYC